MTDGKDEWAPGAKSKAKGKGENYWARSNAKGKGKNEWAPDSQPATSSTSTTPATVPTRATVPSRASSSTMPATSQTEFEVQAVGERRSRGRDEARAKGRGGRPQHQSSRAAMEALTERYAAFASQDTVQKVMTEAWAEWASKNPEEWAEKGGGKCRPIGLQNKDENEGSEGEEWFRASRNGSFRCQ
jgi:hypothetical protein